MTEANRTERVDIGVMKSSKFKDVYAKEFTCMAAGKVAGNLDALIAEIKGSCKVEGDVISDLLKIGGAMKVEGNIQAELIRAKGSFKVEGTVNADNFRITGATKVEKSITSKEEVSVMGVLKCEENVIAGRFTLLGVVDIEDTLKASLFKADLSGKSTIKNLEADTIHVKVSENHKQKTELICKKITGKDIYLEATTAEYVEGENVVLGPKCSIAQVKAANLDVHNSSKVGKKL